MDSGHKFVGMTLTERILSRCVVDSLGCLIFSGTPSKSHPVTKHRGRAQQVSRLMYEDFVGPVEAGLELDHLCRNTRCVNPAHLDPVSHRENTVRGIGPTAVNARKDRCVHGHLFTDQNTYKDPQGYRHCRECGRAADRRWYAHHGKAQIGGSNV